MKLEFEAEKENGVATWTVLCAWTVTQKTEKWNPTISLYVNSNWPTPKTLAAGLTKGH